MALKTRDLEYAFLFVGGGYKGESFAFIHRESGDCYFLSNAIDIEVQELPDGYETRADFESDDQYISLPHKSDLELGRQLIFDFARECMPEHEDEVRTIFRNRGAYKSYRGFLERRNRLEDWYKFENERTLIVLRKWCAENEIELTD